MNRLFMTVSLTLALGLMTTACHRDSDEAKEHGETHEALISEADAKAVTDATVATWGSMDAAKIDALYAPDVVGFDVFAAPLSTDRANWSKNQKGFADAKFDKVTVTSSKTQILDDDDFIFSTVADLTSTTGPQKALAIRCTDVFRKQADGKFLIVNEHCSQPPKAA
jgi:ketosteroid isomerase-like protein